MDKILAADLNAARQLYAEAVSAYRMDRHLGCKAIAEASKFRLETCREVVGRLPLVALVGASNLLNLGGELSVVDTAKMVGSCFGNYVAIHDLDNGFRFAMNLEHFGEDGIPASERVGRMIFQHIFG